MPQPDIAPKTGSLRSQPRSIALVGLIAIAVSLHAASAIGVILGAAVLLTGAVLWWDDARYQAVKDEEWERAYRYMDEL